MKKVAILQSNYMPWKGYFDLIAAVDEFIIFDEMQYTRRDWRNRNQIKTPQGLQWLTIPVQVKGKYHQKINETRVESDGWRETHWKALKQNYRQAPHYAEIMALIEPLYLEQAFSYLSEVNRAMMDVILKYLDINTQLTYSSDYFCVEGKTERLVSLCTQAGATHYISGPAAKDYVQKTLFDEAGIDLAWFDYTGYPEYPQLYGEFTHTVSILDLLFNCGKDAPQYMKYV